MENHGLFVMHESTPISAELASVGEELAKTSAKIDNVELALSGHGIYLGITDKNKLMSQLEVLQTKEAQLQKKELLIMGGALRPPYSEATSAAKPPPTSLTVLPASGASTTSSGGLPSTVSAISAVAAAAAAAMASAKASSHGYQHQHQHQIQIHHGPKTPPLMLTPHQLFSQAMLAVDADNAVPDSVPSPNTSDAMASAIDLSLSSPISLRGAPPSLPVRPSDAHHSRVPNANGIEINSSASPNVMESFGGAKGAMLPVMTPPASASPLPTIPADPSNESLGLSLGVGLGLEAGARSVATARENGPNHSGHAVDHVIGEEQIAVLERMKVTPVKRRGIRTASSVPSKKRPRLSAQCVHPGCTTARTFGHEGSKDASFCAVHKEQNMVNIKGRRCQEPGCPHRPGFAIPGERRGKFCASHRLSGMVDVVSRKCQVEGGGCNRQPVYGWPGERATRCGTHKLERTLTDPSTGKAVMEKMHDVRGKRCQEPGCIRQPGFGNPVKDKGSVMCNEHKLPGMTNVRKRRALERLSKLKDPTNSSFGDHSQGEILHNQRQAQAAAAIAAAAAAAAAAASSAAQQQAQLGPVSVLGDYYESFPATQTCGAGFDVSIAEPSSYVVATVTAGGVSSSKSTVGGVCLGAPHSRDESADLDHHHQQHQQHEEDEQPSRGNSSSVPHEQLSTGITGLPTSPLCAPPEELDHVGIGGSSGEVLEVITKAQGGKTQGGKQQPIERNSHQFSGDGMEHHV